jgi:hypothetical protein|tara:strand:- start:244 stop:570 length:327 start_codon:yes stop_codon:yes gene_type:complete
MPASQGGVATARSVVGRKGFETSMQVQQKLQKEGVGCAVDVCGLKYISHPRKLIYFEVPKTGTSSLLSLLKQHASIAEMDERFDFWIILTTGKSLLFAIPGIASGPAI